MSVIVFAALVAPALSYYAMHTYEAAGPARRQQQFHRAQRRRHERDRQRAGTLGHHQRRPHLPLRLRTYLDNETLKAGEYEIKARSSMQM